MSMLDRIRDSFKYLDKNGLKHLIEKIKLHDVHWTGTHAEYEAQKDSIPAYAILHFTDDYDENVGVVDKIEDNNMNGVTSNAVYDALKVTTLTPTKTANVITVYEAEFLRIGRLVFVNLNLVASSGTLFTGLPRPTMRQTFTVNGYNEQDKALRLVVDNDGSIKMDNASAITNQNVGGHIVYVTTEA